MDVTVVGGGPGGLYAAILLKKANPDWTITVYERDPADNTYGWGIVFSDSTLGALREADKPTHEAITDRFTRWDPIDVHLDGATIRCGGHRFAGLMRADLKDILRRRATDLGVDLHWDHTVEDPEALAADTDLLIGADGLNSVTRDTWADAFSPRETTGDAKFSWFGTDKPFDVFTFIFRENEHGLWRVHAYPGRKSTFIVECTEDTWHNAALDEKPEDEALAYFEDLFADHLDGYALESKLYSWRNFPVVSNRRWSHDNVVLVGDAAHTAHFSVGAGTKMAMEDAIALAEGFEEHDGDVAGATNWYEKERRPAVEAIQDAATQSRTYFENTERYTDLPPEQFAFNLLTRSGKISYDELKIRDARYADDYDRWFATRAGDDPTRRAVARPPMFQPLALRDLDLDNRAVLAPTPSFDGATGHPTDAQTDQLVRLGTNGAGLALTEPLAVSARGRIGHGTPGLYDDDHADAWADAVARVHNSSVTAVGAELLHAGQRGATRPRDRGLDRPLPTDEAWGLLSASPTPYTSRSQTPTAMDDADRDRVRDQYVDATARAETAGFDLLQVNLAHGYLLSSYLSPLTNERDDEYGGSLENRLRYPLAVVDAVRDEWPDDRPLAAKVPATDYRPGGFSLEDAFTLGEALADHGVDLLTVVAGQTTSNDRPRFDTDVLARHAEQIRNELGVRTMSTNYVTATDDVNTQVGSATADLCQWHPTDVDVTSR